MDSILFVVHVTKAQFQSLIQNLIHSLHVILYIPMVTSITWWAWLRREMPFCCSTLTTWSSGDQEILAKLQVKIIPIQSFHKNMCHGTGCSDIVHVGKCQAKTLFLIPGNCTISNLLYSICFKTFQVQNIFFTISGNLSSWNHLTVKFFQMYSGMLNSQCHNRLHFFLHR